jgi:3D (Asp-Asp-Asp) domain-containing protein
MDTGLKMYSAEDLRALAYKNDVEVFHSYIVENAKYGITHLDLDLEPTRHLAVSKKLKELFPDTVFTYTGIATATDTMGYIKYRVSWKKNHLAREPYPFKATQYLKF